MTQEKIHALAEVYMNTLAIKFKERQMIHRFMNDILPEGAGEDKIKIIVNDFHKMIENAKL